jgi:thiol:disulfide interchange protein
MAREPLLTTETKTTLVFMFLGLTAWYLVRIFAASDLLELGALIGVGVILPLVINEARRRSVTD